MNWIELSIETYPEAADAVANACRRVGIDLIAVEVPPRDVERDGPLSLPVVEAYLPFGDGAGDVIRALDRALRRLREEYLAPIGPLLWHEIDTGTWNDGCKLHLHPVRVDRVVLTAPWRTWRARPCDIVVDLDAGTAFGTGAHPSTGLMLRELQRRVRPGMQVFDLGTGSGVLAVVAGRLGARVTAVDTDEEAVAASRANVTRNGLNAHISVALGSVGSGEHPYDLVLANLTGPILLDLATEIGASLGADGEVIASGLIREQAAAVRSAFAGAGLATRVVAENGDWLLMTAGWPSSLGIALDDA